MVAIIAALVAAIGLALDTIQVTGINTKWWTIIAFIVFCAFITWIVIDLRNRNKELENKKPSISVKPMVIDDLWYLEIANNGERGIFTAEVSVFDEEDNSMEPKYQSIGSKYNALWGKTNTDKSEIVNGQSDIVRIAAITYTATAKYFEMKAYDTIKKCPYSVKHIEFDGFRDHTHQQEIEVTISSDPSLRGGPFIRWYSISLSGISEVRPKRRMSIPDKYMFGEVDAETEKKCDDGQQTFTISLISSKWWLRVSHGKTSWYAGINESDGIALIFDGEIVINTLKPIQVECIKLEIGNELFSSDWKSDTFYTSGSSGVCFDIPLTITRGKRTAKIEYVIDGISGFSEPFTIDIPLKTV